MEIDVNTLESADRYKLLCGLIVPRPIAFVTTIDNNGLFNAAPFSFFNVVSHEPPLVVLGFGQRANGTAKDTLVNIQDTGEFVINLVDTKLAEPMSHCGIDAPSDIDELEATGLDTAPSHVVRPPRIKSAPASLECRLVDQHHYGKREHAAIVIGQIEHLFVREGLINERFHVDQDLLDLVGRMAGYNYVRTTDRFSLKGTALGQKQGVQV